MHIICTHTIQIFMSTYLLLLLLSLGHLSVVQILLAGTTPIGNAEPTSGADSLLKSSSGLTAAAMAGLGGHMEVLKWLLCLHPSQQRKGGDPWSGTSLMWAAGHTDDAGASVRMLLHNGDDVNAVDSHVHLPLPDAPSTPNQQYRAIRPSSGQRAWGSLRIYRSS